MPEIDLDPNRTAVLQALCERERLLHSPGAATPLADLEALLDAEFCETGASGRHYTRAVAVRELERRRATQGNPHTRPEMAELRCQELAHEVYLLSYLLRQPGRLTRRSSIWRRSAEGWKIIYHQGTLLRAPTDET